MAPELINFGRYNSKIDVWSVGVIIFEMITSDVFLRTNRIMPLGAHKM
jgi:serine/threonine protein kinase